MENVIDVQTSTHNAPMLHTRLDQVRRDRDFRKSVIDQVQTEGGFPNFCNHTIALEGKIAGFREAIDLLGNEAPAAPGRFAADNAASAFESADAVIRQLHDALPEDQREEFLVMIAERYFDETDADVPAAPDEDQPPTGLVTEGLKHRLSAAKDYCVAQAIIQANDSSADKALRDAEFRFDCLLAEIQEIPLPADVTGERDSFFGFEPVSGTIISLQTQPRQIWPDDAPQAVADILYGAFQAREHDPRPIPAAPAQLHQVEPALSLEP